MSTCSHVPKIDKNFPCKFFSHVDFLVDIIFKKGEKSYMLKNLHGKFLELFWDMWTCGHVEIFYRIYHIYILDTICSLDKMYIKMFEIKI